MIKNGYVWPIQKNLLVHQNRCRMCYTTQLLYHGTNRVIPKMQKLLSLISHQSCRRKQEANKRSVKSNTLCLDEQRKFWPKTLQKYRSSEICCIIKYDWIFTLSSQQWTAWLFFGRTEKIIRVGNYGPQCERRFASKSCTTVMDLERQYKRNELGVNSEERSLDNRGNYCISFTIVFCDIS